MFISLSEIDSVVLVSFYWQIMLRSEQIELKLKKNKALEFSFGLDSDTNINHLIISLEAHFQNQIR